MKKTMLLLIVIAFLSQGCSPSNLSRPDDSTQTKKAEIFIGVSMASFDDTFLGYIKDGIEQRAADLSDVKVTFSDANNDVTTQVNQVEAFIAEGVDSIIVNPVNTETTSALSKACSDAKVNLVYVNRLPSEIPDGVTFVGSNSIEAGILQMEYMGEILGGKGNIVIMMGILDNEAAIKRTEGVKKVIAEKYPDIKVIAQQNANWSRSEGMTLMETWLAKGDKIDAVCSNNDDMALGAIDALKAANLLGSMLVSGVDCTPDAAAAIRDGSLTATVFQDAAGQGAGALDAAVQKAKGEKTEKLIMIPFKLVTPENVDLYQ